MKIFRSISILISIFIFVGCQGGLDDTYEDLGSGYFIYEEADIMIIKKDSYKGIHGYIIDYNFDSDFIIAKQKEYEYLKKPRKVFLLFDEIIKLNTNKINYWIIDKKTDFIYGPMTKKQYYNKRRELKIPKGLKLKNE